MSSSAEDEFEEEFNRILLIKEACPLCGRGPVVLDNLGEEFLFAICEVGHMYRVIPNED